MKEQAATHPLCDLLDRLRLSARSHESALLQHDDVLLLMSDEIYGLLAGIEARQLREFDTETACGSAQCDRQKAIGDRESATPSVEELISEWLKFHVSRLAAPDRYYYSARHLQTFFNDERQMGRLGDKVTVKDLTPELQSRFREWRSASGAGGHTLSRDIAALRGALTWAWKHQRIAKPPPFIADVPAHTRSQPRDRVLSHKEVAAILDSCAGRPDREHLIRFIVIELGTAGRPQAVLELDNTNIDLERNLINPNHPGRTHARKRRAIVPMAKAVRPWVIGVEGKLIKYRVALTRGERGETGEYFERETKSIRRSWKAACADAGVSDATPKTLRHTMLTWLAERAGCRTSSGRSWPGTARAGRRPGTTNIYRHHT